MTEKVPHCLAMLVMAVVWVAASGCVEQRTVSTGSSALGGSSTPTRHIQLAPATPPSPGPGLVLGGTSTPTKHTQLASATPPSPSPGRLDSAAAEPQFTTSAQGRTESKGSPTPTPTPTPEPIATPQPAATPTEETPEAVVIRETVIRDYFGSDNLRDPDLCRSSPRELRGIVHRQDVIRWSPDGTEIFFSRLNRMGAGGTAIYAVAADGSHLRPIVAGTAPTAKSTAGESTSFDVSPDGASLVYATCAYPAAEAAGQHSFDLARVAVDGSRVTRLTDSERFEILPAWSPDGRHIAFLFMLPVNPPDPNQLQLHTMTPDGGKVTALTRGNALLDSAVFHSPRWSPDSKRLAFVTYAGRGMHDFSGYIIRVVAVDGWDGTRVAQPTVSGPSWSPDGTRIAFAKPDGDGIALFTMAADGSDLRRVVPIRTWVPLWGAEDDPARGWVPTVAWSPTGENILIGDALNVYVASLDGAEVGVAPIHFNGGPVAAWSPDGRRIAIAAPVDAVNTEDFNTFFRNEVVFTMAPDGTDIVPLVRADPNDALIAVQSARYRADSVTKACGAGHVVDDPAANPGLVRDCEVLAGLRDPLFGRQVVNWAADVSIYDWLGVIVDGAPPRVTGLAFSLYKADNTTYLPGGTIPPALGALVELKRLDLSANRLWGEIPKELSNLTNLQVLNLANNKFEGPIPPELGRLVNLNTLVLSGNRFSGCIPLALRVLAAEDNDLPSLGMPYCEAAR